MKQSDPIEPLTLRELTSLLIKHHGFREGLFETAIEFKLALGQIGPTPDEALPGAMVGVSRIGLVPADKTGPSVVDAAEVNPARKSSKKAQAK